MLHELELHRIVEMLKRDPSDPQVRKDLDNILRRIPVRGRGPEDLKIGDWVQWEDMVSRYAPGQDYLGGKWIRAPMLQVSRATKLTPHYIYHEKSFASQGLSEGRYFEARGRIFKGDDCPRKENIRGKIERRRVTKVFPAECYMKGCERIPEYLFRMSYMEVHLYCMEHKWAVFG